MHQFSREPWETQNQHFQHRSVYTFSGNNPNLVCCWQGIKDKNFKNYAKWRILLYSRSMCFLSTTGVVFLVNSAYFAIFSLDVFSIDNWSTVFLVNSAYFATFLLDVFSINNWSTVFLVNSAYFAIFSLNVFLIDNWSTVFLVNSAYFVIFPLDEFSIDKWLISDWIIPLISEGG